MLLRIASMLESIWSECICRITYVLMLLLNPGHRLEEIREGINVKMSEKRPIPPPREAKDVVQLYTSQVRRELENEGERRKAIDEKSKVLLTVAGLLLAATGALMPIVWLTMIPVGLLLTTLFLLLRYYRTERYKVVEINNINWNDSYGAMLQLAEQELNCVDDWSARNDLLIGVQRAAFRALTLALVALTILLLCSIIKYEGLGRTGLVPVSRDCKAYESVNADIKPSSIDNILTCSKQL